MPCSRDQVVDVDGQLLAEPVDPADPLFEDGGVPWELDVDDAVRGVLEVKPDAAGIAGEEDAEVGIVVELDDVLGAPALAFGAGEEASAEAAVAEQVAHGPLGEREHSPPLAEDDDLATLLEHELADELAQLGQLGRGEALERAFVGAPIADRGPEALELELGHPVGDDPLGGQQAHELEELGLGEGPFERSLDELRDRLDQVVVGVFLDFGHLDGNAGIGSRWKLVEHVLPNAADHAGLEPVANGVEVTGADHLATAVGRGLECSELKRHLGSRAMSSTHSTTEASSSMRFSIGVPVSTRRYSGDRPLTERAVLVAQFLIRCASSSTTSSGSQRRTISRSRRSCS